MTEWTRDLLLSRGALIESDETALRALLPAEVAAPLGSGEWLSLNFNHSAGSDDPAEWMDRLASLLPARPMCVPARLRTAANVLPFDAAEVLERELGLQNGIFRVVEDGPHHASYLFLTFSYLAESDDRHFGFVDVCVNTSARSAAMHTESLLHGLEQHLEDDPGTAFPNGSLAEWLPAAEQLARVKIAPLTAGMEHQANRRLARDSERVESYYRGLLAQIEKRISKKAASDREAAEKDRQRSAATETDRAAKLEDLRRKYSLRIEMSLAGAMAVRLPVREITARLIRKKEERLQRLHWNPALRLLEPLLCERCSRTAHPLFLCEKVHLLCPDCWPRCADCGKNFCRKCQPRCKCGSTPRP